MRRALAVLAAVVIPGLLWQPPRAPSGDRVDELDAAILEARRGSGLLAVVLLGGSEEDAAWAASRIQRPEWTESLRPHRHVVLRADLNPTLAVRFSAARLPQLIVVDGDGREVGRLEGKQPLEALAPRLRAIVSAAEKYRESAALLSSDPHDIEALTRVGTYLWNRGDRFQGVDCFRRVIQVSLPADERPGDPARNAVASARRYVATHDLDQGRHAQAEDGFREALELEPDGEAGARSSLGLALSLRRQGRVSEAIQVLRRREASPQCPSSEEVLFTLAHLELENGNREDASRHFRACAERYPHGIHGERARRHLDPAPSRMHLPLAGAGAAVQAVR